MKGFCLVLSVRHITYLERVYMLFTSLVSVVRLVLLVLLPVWLLACTSNVRTTITTFKNESAPLSVGTIRVVPVANLPKTKELEFDFYKTKLESKLQDIGYTPVDDVSAKYIAYLHFDVMRRERERDNSDIYFRSTFGYGRGSRHGGIYISDSTAHEFEFVRRMQIGIEEAVSNEKLIEVDAINLGKCEQLTTIADSMLSAIFKDFQRSSGSVERVVVPGKGTCQ